MSFTFSPDKTVQDYAKDIRDYYASPGAWGKDRLEIFHAWSKEAGKHGASTDIVEGVRAELGLIIRGGW